MTSAKLPKTGLKVAHISICSFRKKLIISNISSEGDVHVLAITETHLDSSFEDSVLHIQEYNIHRRDRNANGGGIAIYIQDHLPVKSKGGPNVNRNRSTIASSTYPPFETPISGKLL